MGDFHICKYGDRRIGRNCSTGGVAGLRAIVWMRRLHECVHPHPNPHAEAHLRLTPQRIYDPDLRVRGSVDWYSCLSVTYPFLPKGAERVCICAFHPHPNPLPEGEGVR